MGGAGGVPPPEPSPEQLHLRLKLSGGFAASSRDVASLTTFVAVCSLEAAVVGCVSALAAVALSFFAVA